MEKSKDYKFVNLSLRCFENKIYEANNYSGMGFKPSNALWGSLESKDNEYYSLWDELYRSIYDDDTLFVTTYLYTEDTLVINPSFIKNDLVCFYNDIDKYKDLSDLDIRNLFLNYLKNKNIVDSNINYLICQIDLPEDQDSLEEAFTGFKVNGNNKDSVFENFDYKVRKGMIKLFSGIEVTNYALGIDDSSMDDGIYETEYIKMMNEPRYGNAFDGDTHLGFFEVYSNAIFDTSVIRVIDQKEIELNNKKK